MTDRVITGMAPEQRFARGELKVNK